MGTAELGRFGETKAAEWLTRNGYRILARNFRTRLGEIDIIASKAGFLAFVEVKLRKNADFGCAREFVDVRKQRKIICAAQLWLQWHPCRLQPRFDVIEVYAPFGMEGEVEIHHWENAFSVN